MVTLSIINVHSLIFIFDILHDWTPLVSIAIQQIVLVNSSNVLNYKRKFYIQGKKFNTNNCCQ